MTTPTSPHHSNLPTRTATNNSDLDDAIPDEDSSEVTRLFSHRLAGWKHAVAYLEDYVQASEKMQHAHGKEYEKVLKTVSHPLKEGDMFAQELGGVAGMFDNIRSNTQGISNAHYETAKVLKGSVLPIFERLHTEIKNKTKELSKGAGKSSKSVDKARAASQKVIETHGQHTAAFDSTGGSIKAADDPYLSQRRIYHHLNKQVIEENNNRDDMITVQNNFAQFEAHIVQQIQQGLGQYGQVVGNQANQTLHMNNNIVENAQRISPDFEWNGFLKRNGNLLIDPSGPKRSVESIGFPNQDHRSTQPLISGSLERKGLLKKYTTAYYAVTPAKYLHEFKTDDDFSKEPSPENSLYLPDCLIGAVDGLKFNVKGKDTSGGISSKLARAHEFSFKAHTAADAQRWHSVISSVAGQTTNEVPETSAPSSPVVGRGEMANEGAGYGSTAQPQSGVSHGGYSEGGLSQGGVSQGGLSQGGASQGVPQGGIFASSTGATSSTAASEAAGAGHGVATHDKAAY